MPAYSIHTIFNGVDRVSNAFINMGRSAQKFRGMGRSAFGGVSASGMKFGAVLGGLSLGVLASGALDFAKESIKLYTVQEAAVANVKAGLISTNNVAGKTIDELLNQASELQKNTFFGDEAILQNATAQLLTFTGIVGKNFDRTQSVILDVTAKLNGLNATGENVKSTSIMLGKALNDPIANLGALSRVGIQFSNSQKLQIKSLASSGKLMDAQSIILEELERQYGGAAAALAKTSGGVELQIKNMIGDIKELIGGALSPLKLQFLTIFGEILPKVVPIITEIGNKMSDWVNRNKEMISTKVVDFFNNFMKTLEIIVPLIGDILPIALKLAPAFMAWQAAVFLTNIGLGATALLINIGKLAEFINIVMMIAKAEGIWVGVQQALNFAMKDNPLGLITTAIFLLIGAGYLLVKNWDVVKSFFISMWGGIKTAFSVSVDFMTKALFTFADVILSTYGNIFKMIIKGAATVGRFIGLDVSGLDTLVKNIDTTQKDVRAKSFIGGNNEKQAPNAMTEEQRKAMRGEGTLTIRAEKGTEITGSNNGIKGVNLAFAGAN